MSTRSSREPSAKRSPGGGSAKHRRGLPPDSDREAALEVAAHRPRGRPPTIDREAVLDTAIRLLDAEGVEALTMRRLASELGVSAMAPYRHVDSKDELLMVLVDRLAARLVYPLRPRGPEGSDASVVVDDLRQPRGAPLGP